MFIQTEPTPNPATLKFIPNREVAGKGSASYTDNDTAKASPLAVRIFDVPGVRGVFLGHDFISVTKEENREWMLMKPAIFGAIMDHFSSGDPVILESAPAEPPAGAVEDDEVVAQIKELLDTRVRPAVAQDGGDIVFHEFVDGVVYLEMHGACAGCPSSTATLKMGIENMLRYYIPDVVEVRPVY